MSQTRKLMVELDPREIRALHFTASLANEALPKDSLEQIPLPDGRKVWPIDSGLMALEAVMIANGEEL